jgi:hypothetical protein
LRYYFSFSFGFFGFLFRFEGKIPGQYFEGILPGMIVLALVSSLPIFYFFWLIFTNS